MKHRLFFLFSSILLFSTITTSAYAQESDYDPYDVLIEKWDWTQQHIQNLWDSIRGLEWLNPLRPLLEWLGDLWSGFVGSIEDFFNWLWQQFYGLFIDPLVAGWKAATASLGAMFRAPLDQFVTWMTVSVPSWFTATFGTLSPVFLTVFAIIIVVALYYGVKLLIMLL